MSVPVTLSEFDRQDTRGQVFTAEHNYARTIWPRMNKFGKLARGRDILLGVSHIPHPRVGVPMSPRLWDPHAITV